ncbi:MAG: ParB/RepB/Spo0J family partition protein [Sedimentisphaerales bacterium]
MNEQAIKPEAIDDGLSFLRLTRPEQISWMQHSMETVGQLRSVIVRRKGTVYQLLDGFKRYYACQALKWDTLQAHIVQVDDITAKAMIISYNQQGSSLIDYEEAQIVYSLKKDHLMSQQEIAKVLSRSYSWVSRRLSFIERLEEGVRTHLQLGRITPSHARELVKLPRGKQAEFLKLIIGHNLTSRQSSMLIREYLLSRTNEEQTYLLGHPLEIIERALHEEEIHDSRLSLQGNRILRASRQLALQQHIFIGVTTNPPLKELRQMDGEILTAGFTDIIRKIKIIQSILKPYESHER